jgi:predicted metal-binding membrane protein
MRSATSSAPGLPGPGTLQRRERAAILTGLIGVSTVAWIYLVVMARAMNGMTAGDAMGMATMAIRPWSPAQFVLTFVMWAVMMVGMMVPTVIPMSLVYAAVVRKAMRQGSPIAPTGAFVAGYVAVWTAFSLGATALQWLLDSAALLSPMMVATSPALGAALLIGAGVYQLTPFKDACLRHCRAPAHFLAQHWRNGLTGAFRMGVEHGAFCLGCCWVLMLLLFLGGVMNLLWIAALTLFVLLEKVLPLGESGGRWAGAAMVASGLAMLAVFLAARGPG